MNSSEGLTAFRLIPMEQKQIKSLRHLRCYIIITNLLFPTASEFSLWAHYHHHQYPQTHTGHSSNYFHHNAITLQVSSLT